MCSLPFVYSKMVDPSFTQTTPEFKIIDPRFKTCNSPKIGKFMEWWNGTIM